MSLREITEAQERAALSRYALCSADSKGRPVPEPLCGVRTCFQRDVDRVIYSKAFRRLAHKTQVFLNPEGDHYRTRLTHTLEVTRIARTMARALRLNEDLTEAAALGHDLGHTPFGHAGEAVLNKLTDGGFRHNEQGVRVLGVLEKSGKGLNICREVSDGILCHTGDKDADTLECRLIRYADRIAYINHDFDDAARGGLLDESALPAHLRDCLGRSPSERINTLVCDLVEYSTDKPDIGLSPEREKAMMELREFMFERVYTNPVAKSQEKKGQELLSRLFEFFTANPDEMPADYGPIREKDGTRRAAADYIACMTDRYAVMCYSELAIPKGWSVIN